MGPESQKMRAREGERKRGKRRWRGQERSDAEKRNEYCLQRVNELLSTINFLLLPAKSL